MNDIPTLPEFVAPHWADADTTAMVVALAAAGETQAVELKERFPAQARDVAKEIAAFATSNAGTILFGVSDAGDVVGLAGCDTPAGRDGVRARIEGVCANVVKPSITPHCRFAWIAGRTVLVVEVPKGDAPVYYAGNVPYLRQLSASRPAEPQEVVDLVLAWHRARVAADEPGPEAEFLTRVASLSAEVLVLTSEIEERSVNPWLDRLRGELASLATIARDLAASAPAALAETAAPLEQLAAKLDEAAHQRLFIGGGWDEMNAAAGDAGRLAADIKASLFNRHRIDTGSMDGLADTVITTGRKLAGLAARAEEMDDQGRLDEIQASAGEYGLTLRRACTYGVGLGGNETRGQIEAIGQMLRRIETERIYADGGQSVRRVIDGIQDASGRLTALTENLQRPSET